MASVLLGLVGVGDRCGGHTRGRSRSHFGKCRDQDERSW